MLDITLLRIMKYRSEYYKLVRAVPKETLDTSVSALVEDFGKYFKKFPEHTVIDLQVFLPCFQRWHPTIKKDQLDLYTGILKNVVKDVDDCTQSGVLADIFELDLGTKIANMCQQYNEGDLDMPLVHGVSSLVDSYKINIGADTATWIDEDIADILKCDEDESGVKWRLSCLSNSMRPLRGGDFGMIAARPDQGKTTLLASEVTYMAGQLPSDKNIIWLNNEGPGKRILPRLYQAALNKTLAEIIQMSNAGKLIPAYEKAVGRRDKIRVVDIHGWHVGQVESVIESMNTGVVLYDMIDHIKGFGGEARTDLQLEEMYKWGRERAVKYDCIGICTSQISAEGDGLMYPGMSMLKDSKTGKQGAVDFQIMIGSSNDKNLGGQRFIGIPKNKLRRDGFPGDPQEPVMFKPMTARYEDRKNE